MVEAETELQRICEAFRVRENDERRVFNARSLVLRKVAKSNAFIFTRGILVVVVVVVVVFVLGSALGALFGVFTRSCRGYTASYRYELLLSIIEKRKTTQDYHAGASIILFVMF